MMTISKRISSYQRWPAFITGLLGALFISACVQNPVTGNRDLLLVSEDWELQVGSQQYLPLRQQQGGDYTVDPQVESYVRRVGSKLAANSDRDLPYEFNVINDSTANAWALPGGKISINRGLLVELNSEAELAAVLGHEIVHAAAKHGARGQTRGVGLQLGVMTATILAQNNGYNGQVAQMASSVGANIINSQYGQSAELEADRFGIEYMARSGYDPKGAVDLQRTFVRLSEGRSSGSLERLFASHPPSQKRVAENIATAQKLPAGGFTGEAEYKRAMATLFKTKEAYSAHDEARAAVSNGDVRRANSLINTAIRLEPREPIFYTLQGDIALSQNNTDSARRSYDKAISLDGEYFYNYVQRGRIFEAQNNTKAAQADYARSLRLLPTATAQLGLGIAAERDGRADAARRFYASAIQAGDNKVVRSARQGLQRLQQPNAETGQDNSLLVRQGVSRTGEFMIEIINQTSRPVTDVVLGVTAGRNTQRRLPVRGVISSGDSKQIPTGQKLTQAQAASVKVVVLSARAARR